MLPLLWRRLAAAQMLGLRFRISLVLCVVQKVSSAPPSSGALQGVCVCLIASDLDTSTMRLPRPELSVAPRIMLV
jgi:hypothetical protein